MEQWLQRKLQIWTGVKKFNLKPKTGITFLQNNQLLSKDASEVASFLSKTEGIDKEALGDYLGEPDEWNLKVMY